MSIGKINIFIFDFRVDKQSGRCYNKGTNREEIQTMNNEVIKAKNKKETKMEIITMITNNYFDTIHWNFIGTISELGVTVDEYIDDSNTYLKQVWDDGSVEIHEIAD